MEVGTPSWIRPRHRFDGSGCRSVVKRYVLIDEAQMAKDFEVTNVRRIHALVQETRSRNNRAEVLV